MHCLLHHLSSEPSSAPCDPTDDSQLCPDLKELTSSLQDKGTPDAKSQARMLKCKKTEKFSRDLCKKWKELGFPNLPQNATRAKEAITKALIQLWKQVDCTKVHECFHACGKKGQVFIISNTEDTGGFPIVISAVANHWGQTHAKKWKAAHQKMAFALWQFFSNLHIMGWFKES